MDPITTETPELIRGLTLHARKVFADERGAVLHMLRSDSPLFSGFGEVYFSEVNPGRVKAWKRHRRMTQRLCVPVGRVKFVLFDDRPDSPSLGRLVTCTLGRPDNYTLLIIPPQIWYGFQGIGDGPSLIANCADLPHDPDESELIGEDAAFIPHRWRG